jgi:serine/threonine-protein kinase
MTPIQMQDPLQPGALLAGQYHVERVLRVDRTERRYLAKDLLDGMRTLTLQELVAPPFPTNDARGEAAAWLEQRVDHMRQLAHPGICMVRGVHVLSSLAGPFYVAYEHVPGMTLAEEYEEAEGELSWRQILDWGINLCDALEYLHTQTPPWVLGSLHPRHVVLDARSGRPVLIDAGLARWLNPAPGYGWGFVPFEQLLGREDPRSDVYALGTSLHTLLSGHDPDAEFIRLRRAGLDVQRALRRLHPPLDAVGRGVPQALGAAIAQAVAFTPDDRFSSAAAMGAALRSQRGPAVEVETPVAERAEAGPVWERLGMTRQAWFALPLAERNRRLLGLVPPPSPEHE